MLDTEITPELVPTGEDEEIQSSEASVGPYALQDFTLFHVLRLRIPAVEDRVPRLARVAATPKPATGRPASRRTTGRPTPSPRSGTGWRCSRSASSAFSQFKRSALPNGPKVVRRRIALAARRLARAVGLVGPTWLEEIEREVPED